MLEISMELIDIAAEIDTNICVWCIYIYNNI